MILDELVLDNVGVFAGRQVLTLTPLPGGDRPVILIGGMNGCGKTTLLDAIQLALHGPLARLSGRRGSYDSYLRDLIHRGASPKVSAAVELTFHAFYDRRPQSFRIRRSWRGTGKGLREDVVVYRDGMVDHALTEGWAERVEAFIPRGVAALFFFDGEKIEAMAELANSRELLGTALGGLLGLDLTEQLSVDLLLLERRHRESHIPAHAEAAMAAIRHELATARKAKDDAGQDSAESRVRLERAEKHAFEMEERYRLEGGELFERRSELIAKKGSLTRHIASVEQQLRAIAADCAPLLLLRERLAATINQAEAELAAAREQELLALLEDRDSNMIQALEAARVSAAARTKLKRLLSEDRQRRRSLTKQEHVTALDAEVVSRGRTLLDQTLPALRAEIARLTAERAALQEDLAAVEQRLAAVPTEESVRALQKARDEAQTQVTRAVHICQQGERKFNLASRRCEDVERQYEKALSEAADQALQATESRRIVEHTERVRATLAAFRVEAIRRHGDRIQQLVLACLNELLRKQGFITDLHIDPETFEVSFYARDGARIRPHQMSAGERQLVAVSLLWGLAQASGRPLPVVIDTPLGRLDSSHRAHLIERYFPNASHQVLLLSTDTEIDDPAWRSLREHISHVYRLEHDSATDTTTVKDGYFWPENEDAD